MPPRPTTHLIPPVLTTNHVEMGIEVALTLHLTLFGAEDFGSPPIKELPFLYQTLVAYGNVLILR